MSFLYTLLAFTGVVLCLLVGSKLREERWLKSNQHHTQHHAIHANTSESGHAHTYYVTKDPDEYAKIFAPKDAKNQ